MATTKIAWYRTIRIKLIAVIILVTSTILGMTGYLAYRYIDQREYAQLSELAEVSAMRLAHHLVIPMWNLDREQVSDLLAAEMQERRVAAIVIRDEDSSTLFAAKERARDGSVVESIGSVAGDFVVADMKVLRNDEEIGTVSVFVTPRFTDLELQNFGQGVVVTVLILNILIFLVMMMMLGRLLINPIMMLAAGAERISTGDLNQKFDTTRRDELGYLATTFSKMQSSLRLAIRRLTKGR